MAEIRAKKLEAARDTLAATVAGLRQTVEKGAATFDDLVRHEIAATACRVAAVGMRKALSTPAPRAEALLRVVEAAEVDARALGEKEAGICMGETLKALTVWWER
jgi:hypothetical protein